MAGRWDRFRQFSKILVADCQESELTVLRVGLAARPGSGRVPLILENLVTVPNSNMVANRGMGDFLAQQVLAGQSVACRALIIRIPARRSTISATRIPNFYFRPKLRFANRTSVRIHGFWLALS